MADRDRLPSGGLHVGLMFPRFDARGQVLDSAHAVKLSDPVVPSLTEIGRTAGADRADQLLTRLRLGHVLDPDLEILLRLIEALDQRVHQRDARRLGNTPLEAHRRSAPGLSRRYEGGRPPAQISCSDHARRDELLEKPTARWRPAVAHFSSSLFGQLSSLLRFFGKDRRSCPVGQRTSAALHPDNRLSARLRRSIADARTRLVQYVWLAPQTRPQLSALVVRKSANCRH